jgi:hypothetical protein
MIRLLIVARKGIDLYALLVKKQAQLHRGGRGTLHRRGKKERGRAKWRHVKYDGWIWLEKCRAGVVLVEIFSRAAGGESQLMNSLVGFLDRHFRDELATVSIHYD